MRGNAGERAIIWATASALGLLALFFVGLVTSMLAYVDGHILLRALLSEEVLFAIRLSLVTATLATILSLAVAIPAAYAISKGRFPGKGIVDSLLDLPIKIPRRGLSASSRQGNAGGALRRPRPMTRLNECAMIRLL